MAQLIHRKWSAVRMAAALTTLSVAGALGIDLAAARTDNLKATASADPFIRGGAGVRSKDVVNGSLLFKDFKRGELTRRFPTKSSFRRLEDDVREMKMTFTPLLSDVRALKLGYAPPQNLEVRELKVEFTKLQADFLAHKPAIDGAVAALQGDVNSLKLSRDAAGTAVAKRVKVPVGGDALLVSLAGLGTITVDDSGAQNGPGDTLVFANGSTAGSLQILIDDGTTTKQIDVPVGKSVPVDFGAGAAQIDVQIIGPEHLATLALAAPLATADGRTWVAQGIVNATP